MKECRLQPIAKCVSVFVGLAMCLTIGMSQLQAGTIDDLRKRGKVNCGVNEGLLGFGQQDAQGQWQGFDIDFCRAVSTAVLGKPDLVNYIPLSAADRFNVLKSGKIDLLSRNTTWTMERDVDLELEFAGISYYDGQGFMVRKELGLSSALQLEGRSVCVRSNTTSSRNIDRYFKLRKLDVEIMNIDEIEDVTASYESKKCDAYTADRSALAAIRLGLSAPDDHMMLPEVISKEPLGPVVRQGDRQWTEIVRWVLFVLINAEEAGISQQSFKSGEAALTRDYIAQTLNSQASAKLGLEPDWAQNVIRLVGNYGEIFDRHLGLNSALKLPRGLNGLWTRQGILYAPPLK